MRDPLGYPVPLTPDASYLMRSYHLRRAYVGRLVDEGNNEQWKCPHHHRTMEAAMECARKEGRSRHNAMLKWREFSRRLISKEHGS